MATGYEPNVTMQTIGYENNNINIYQPPDYQSLELKRQHTVSYYPPTNYNQQQPQQQQQTTTCLEGQLPAAPIKQQFNDQSTCKLNPNQSLQSRFYASSNNQNDLADSTGPNQRQNIDRCLDRLNEMREKLFRIVSKVPIQVDPVLIAPTTTSSNGTASSTNCSKSIDREPLVIKYYYEKSLEEILELHFESSLLKYDHDYGIRHLDDSNSQSNSDQSSSAAPTNTLYREKVKNHQVNQQTCLESNSSWQSAAAAVEFPPPVEANHQLTSVWPQVDHSQQFNNYTNSKLISPAQRRPSTATIVKGGKFHSNSRQNPMNCSTTSTIGKRSQAKRATTNCKTTTTTIATAATTKWPIENDDVKQERANYRPHNFNLLDPTQSYTPLVYSSQPHTIEQISSPNYSTMANTLTDSQRDSSAYHHHPQQQQQQQHQQHQVDLMAQTNGDLYNHHSTCANSYYPNQTASSYLPLAFEHQHQPLPAANSMAFGSSQICELSVVDQQHHYQQYQTSYPINGDANHNHEQQSSSGSSVNLVENWLEVCPSSSMISNNQVEMTSLDNNNNNAIGGDCSRRLVQVQMIDQGQQQQQQPQITSENTDFTPNRHSNSSNNNGSIYLPNSSGAYMMIYSDSLNRSGAGNGGIITSAPSACTTTGDH